MALAAARVWLSTLWRRTAELKVSNSRSHEGRHSKVQPDYPAIAKQLHLEGAVGGRSAYRQKSKRLGRVGQTGDRATRRSGECSRPTATVTLEVHAVHSGRDESGEGGRVADFQLQAVALAPCSSFASRRARGGCTTGKWLRRYGKFPLLKWYPMGYEAKPFGFACSLLSAAGGRHRKPGPLRWRDGSGRSQQDRRQDRTVAGRRFISQLTFAHHGNAVMIPYKDVNTLEYGMRDKPPVCRSGPDFADLSGRRRRRPTSWTIGYTDQEGKQQAMVPTRRSARSDIRPPAGLARSRRTGRRDRVSG